MAEVPAGPGMAYSAADGGTWMAAANEREERPVTAADLKSGVKLIAGRAVLLTVSDACGDLRLRRPEPARPQPSAR